MKGGFNTIRAKLATGLFSVVLPLWFGPFWLPTAPAQDANVPKDAWWNFLAAGLPAPPPTTVPEDAIAVGHNAVQADKVAAMGITLQAPAGSSVQTLALSLKEMDEAGATLGAEGAALVACPVTGPWEPVHNGNWADAPTYDCELGKAEGRRSEDGTWTFDLLGLGRQWLDAEFPLEQAGVMLLIEESSAPVQISLFGVRSGEFRLEFAASTPDEPEPTTPVVVGGLPAPEEQPSQEPAPLTQAPPAEEKEPAILETRPAQSQREQIGEPDVLGNLPWGVWLLVPLALGAAAAVSYALGPAGKRLGSARRREGPVSRALSRRSPER